jgi:hypothetical protein
MPSRAGMLCRVTIRRTIATQRDAARLTSAQVNPLITDLHALFTFATLRMLNRLDSFDMSTTFIIIHNAGILPVPWWVNKTPFLSAQDMSATQTICPLEFLEI